MVVVVVVEWHRYSMAIAMIAMGVALEKWLEGGGGEWMR